MLHAVVNTAIFNSASALFVTFLGLLLEVKDSLMFGLVVALEFCHVFQCPVCPCGLMIPFYCRYYSES